LAKEDCAESFVPSADFLNGKSDWFIEVSHRGFENPLGIWQAAAKLGM